MRIIEKIMIIFETCIKSKVDSKVWRNKETKSVGKTTSRETSPPEKSTNFHEIQRNFYDSEYDNNAENRLLDKGSKIENDINEDTYQW